MNRFAIGYSPNPEEIDRAIIVFIETDSGVLVQRRGEGAPLLVDQPVEGNSDGTEVRPGDPLYFDIVLDGFSTNCLIRTVNPFEGDVFASMLASDENWEMLPRRGVPI